MLVKLCGYAHTIIWQELRIKGLECYMLLDDWITSRFSSEMISIREFLYVIKDAIESESRIPNSLILDGVNENWCITFQDKFKIDFQTLTYQPPPEPRPESPLEKKEADRFTVHQLLNLGRQFRLIAPSGFVAYKEFCDSIQRISILSQGMDLLPECLMADTSQLSQMCGVLDPYDTGFINWLRFIIVYEYV